MSTVTYMDSGRKYLIELTLVNGRKVTFKEYDHKIYNNIINREIEGHYFVSLRDINGIEVFINLKQCVSFEPVLWRKNRKSKCTNDEYSYVCMS